MKGRMCHVGLVTMQCRWFDADVFNELSLYIYVPCMHPDWIFSYLQLKDLNNSTTTDNSTTSNEKFPCMFWGLPFRDKYLMSLFFDRNVSFQVAKLLDEKSWARPAKFHQYSDDTRTMYHTRPVTHREVHNSYRRYRTEPGLLYITLHYGSYLTCDFFPIRFTNSGQCRKLIVSGALSNAMCPPSISNLRRKQECAVKVSGSHIYFIRCTMTGSLKYAQ